MTTRFVHRFISITILALVLPAQVSGFGLRKLDEEFLKALALYADNQADQAVTHFLEVLNPSLKQDATIFHRWRRLALQLSEEDPQALLPILGLYSKAHGQLLIHQDARSAARVLKEIELFLERHVARSNEAEVRQPASRLLTHVALQVRDLESIFLALPLLRQAIEFDERNLAAHHLLVTLLEKQGHLDVTIDALNQMLEIEPEHAEARLRWAVVQGRRGRQEEALDSFRRLIEGTGEPWMRLLAVQESAKLIARAGEVARAIAVLDEALEDFPGNEHLLLQRAFLTREDVVASGQVITALVSRSWPEELSPRVPYNNWPIQPANELRRQLAADITARLSVLERLLEERVLLEP